MFWKRKEKPFEATLGEELVGKFDARSSTWVFLKQLIIKEIAVLREQNDKPLDADKTASIRGQIKALRKLLEVETGPDRRPQTPADYAGEEY